MNLDEFGEMDGARQAYHVAVYRTKMQIDAVTAKMQADEAQERQHAEAARRRW